ncbi:signal transducer and transcription activator-like isoform X2 [Sitodiplosis mosellana]|uniref:signal transducer and transcription activator-like isoform X2 n=1 Tax=Sitodiplosis mosellana TaxID=263140 RepID=UPI0024450D91|nr:signal transducer and transcription activator-like isoform X2 [Sitodiplosis mosellana]
MEKNNAHTFCDFMTNPQHYNVESDESVKYQIDNNIQYSQNLTTENKAAVEAFKTFFIKNYQQFNQCQQRIQELNNVPSTTEIEDQKRVLMDEANFIGSCIIQQGGRISTSIQTVNNLLNEAQQILIDKRLTMWKYYQILAGFGDKNIKPEPDSHNKNPELQNALDNIQTQFQGLFKCALSAMRMLDIIRKCYGHLNYVDDLVANAFGDITIVLKKLIQSSFIKDQQPPQVITEGTRFEASVRVLLPKYIVIAQNPPEVKVSFLSESQTRQQQHQQQRPKNANSGKIDMDKCCFKISSSNDRTRLECHLNKMKLTNIKRNSERGTNKSVMDEKFCLLFETDLQMLGPINSSVRVWTMSVPVTAASNVCQKRDGLATIAWDNAFFEIGRTTFAVPTKVHWYHMEQALSMIFYHQTGCYLTAHHLQSLYEKVFGPSPREHRSMSWEQFGKAQLQPHTDFSFFTWFYEAAKLTRVHLSEQWKLIAGFISKDKATEELLKYEPGTFLLRFSDSALGISVAWVQLNAYGTKEVKHMQPFVHADFENKEGGKEFRSIGDLIKNHHKCTHLYPGMIPKYKAFAEYFTQPNATKKGYVPKQYTFLAPPEENEVSSSSSPSSASPSVSSPSVSSPSSPSPSSFCPSSPFPNPSVSSFFSPNSTQNRQSPSRSDYIDDIIKYLEEPMDIDFSIMLQTITGN